MPLKPAYMLASKNKRSLVKLHCTPENWQIYSKIKNRKNVQEYLIKMLTGNIWQKKTIRWIRIKKKNANVFKCSLSLSITTKPPVGCRTGSRCARVVMETKIIFTPSSSIWPLPCIQLTVGVSTIDMCDHIGSLPPFRSRLSAAMATDIDVLYFLTNAAYLQRNS